MTDMDEDLKKLFQAGQAQRPVLSDEFKLRLQADIDASVPRPEVRPVQVPAKRFQWLKGALTASGLSGAAILGISIGFFDPDTLNGFVGTNDDALALYAFFPGAEITGLTE